MRGVVDAFLRRVRTRRQMRAIVRSADQSTASAERSPEATFWSRVWRGSIEMSTQMMLAVAILAALSVGVAEMGHRAQPVMPYTVVAPDRAAPTPSPNAPADAVATSGPAPITASLGTGAGRGPVASTAVAAAPASSAAAVPSSMAAVATSTSVSPIQRTAAAATATAGVSPVLLNLCRSVIATGDGWPSVIKGADRQLLIATAGSHKAVLPYCTGLLA